MAISLSALVPLDRYNWELCLEIKMSAEQQLFVPPILYSLAQSKFENLTPYGIMHGDDIIGFIMYGEFSGICWINRIVIDVDYQRLGIGTSAIIELIQMLKGNFRCREIRTSYADGNFAAEQFFQALGFRPISEPIDGEVVATYEGHIHV